MYYKARFTNSDYTETVYITSVEGFKAYSEICGNAPLTIDFENKTITVHEK